MEVVAALDRSVDLAACAVPRVGQCAFFLVLYEAVETGGTL